MDRELVVKEEAIQAVKNAVISAMDACEGHYDEETGDYVYNRREVNAMLKVNKKAVAALKDLPTAQPALDEWCTDCAEYDHDHHCCPRYNRVIRTAMQSVQPETAKRIVGKSSRGVTMWYQCDMCKEPVDEKDTYCSGCGRRLVNE